MKFTQEHRQITDTVVKFCEKELNPHIAEWEAAQEFPSHEVFKKLGNLGLLGLKYPEEFGGAGLERVIEGHGFGPFGLRWRGACRSGVSVFAL